MRQVRRYGLALAVAAVTMGCQTAPTTQPGVVGVERRQAMLISSDSINQAADQAYRQTLEEARKQGKLNRDAATLARVRAISQRLIPQSGAFRPDAQAWKWETNVIAAKDVNAWCMPGGKIAVYTGLIDSLKPTDDELAAVMGHEIAHALREHGRERASQAMAQQIILDVVTVVAGLPDETKKLSGVVLDLTFNLPNSRTHEIEADRVGVELAARAGYDPRAAVSLWRKMQRLGDGQPPEFLSTHPSHETRIEDLRRYAERVMPLYEAARANR